MNNILGLAGFTLLSSYLVFHTNSKTLILEFRFSFIILFVGVCVLWLQVCLLTTGPDRVSVDLCVSLWKLKFAPDALATFSRMVSGSTSSSPRAFTVTCAPCDQYM